MKAIADAIREKDGTTEPIAANDFPARIRAIPSGGGDPVKPLDAKRVREIMRDTAWPPMPEDVPEHTIVLLLAPTSSVSFSVTCDGQYTVEVKLCSLVDGVWEYEVESSSLVDSDTVYEKTYPPGSDKRYRLMTISAASITGFSITGSSIDATYLMVGVVELLCRLPGMNVPILQGMKDLTWVTELGVAGTSPSSYTGAFRNCGNLRAVICPDLMAHGNRTSLFTGCRNLLAVDFSVYNQEDTTISATYLFDGCNLLNAFDQSLFYNIGTAGYAFRDCFSLREVIFYTNRRTSITISGSYFTHCLNLEKIVFSGQYSMRLGENTFIKLPSLKHLIFDLPLWSGTSFSIKGCAFERSGLVEMFQSLPTTTGNKSITITGNPGAEALTEEDKAIATAKGWTLVL